MHQSFGCIAATFEQQLEYVQMLGGCGEVHGVHFVVPGFRARVEIRSGVEKQPRDLEKFRSGIARTGIALQRGQAAGVALFSEIRILRESLLYQLSIAQRGGCEPIRLSACFLEALHILGFTDESRDDDGARGWPCPKLLGIGAVCEQPVETCQPLTRGLAVRSVRLFLKKSVEGAIATPHPVQVGAVLMQKGERVGEGYACCFHRCATGRAGGLGHG